MNKYEQRLNDIISILLEFDPQKIYAYGSWTKGTAKSDSDIDLAVVVNENADVLRIKRKFAERLWEKRYPYDLEPDIRLVPKDIFEYRLSKGDPFITSVVSGKLVYGS